MMQSAPGASLDFYTAFVSQQDFAAGILALANAGCRVICDDGKWERSLHLIHAPTGKHLYDCHSKPVRSQSGPHQRGRRRQF